MPLASASEFPGGLAYHRDSPKHAYQSEESYSRCLASVVETNDAQDDEEHAGDHISRRVHANTSLVN